MPRHLTIAILLSIAALLGAGVAHGELSQSGNLRISFKGNFEPRTLPRDRPAPITFTVAGAIGTTDGSHPPAVRRMEFAINRHGKLSTEGLPVCSSQLLQSTSTKTALRRCGGALVGRGSFKARVEFPSVPFPAAGTILVFNGVQNGRRAMLLHLYGTTPVRVTFILPLLISHRPKGQFGTVLSANVPKLAGGLGSVTEIDLKVGRNYTYRGKRRSFISAMCAAPAGFPGAIFSFARGTFHFADGRTLNTTVVRDCRVR